MKQEQTGRTGKTFPPEQTTNSEEETAENQQPNAISVRRIDTDRAVVGEHSFQNRRVRTIAIEGETWFFAAEVCEVLGHTNPRRAIERLEPDEKV